LSNLKLTDQKIKSQSNTPSAPSASTSRRSPTFPIPVISVPKSFQTTFDEPSFPPMSLKERLDKFKIKTQKPKALKRLDSERRCAFCNSYAHHINDCPTLENVICKNCNQKGHTAKRCINPPKQIAEDY
jgi:hypothetical protein